MAHIDDTPNNVTIQQLVKRFMCDLLQYCRCIPLWYRHAVCSCRICMAGWHCYPCIVFQDRDKSPLPLAVKCSAKFLLKKNMRF